MTPSELKKARTELALTQQQMAKELNTPLSTYRKWEQGSRRVPSIVSIAIKCIKKEG